MPAGQRAVGIPVDLGVIMGVQIDEPWRDDEPVGIKRFLGLARAELADLGDLAILDAKVPGVAWRAGTIDDCATLDNHIKFGHNRPSFSN